MFHKKIFLAGFLLFASLSSVASASERCEENIYRCVDAFVARGSSEIQSFRECKGIANEGQDICAGALAENSGYGGSYIVNDCKWINTRLEGRCAAAYVKKGYSATYARSSCQQQP